MNKQRQARMWALSMTGKQTKIGVGVLRHH